MTLEEKRQKNFFDICNGCIAECCHGTRPPITSKRKKIIEKYLKEQKISIEKPFVSEDYTFPREQANGYCIFYNKEKGTCIVHLVKPETCVAGPITFDINKKTRKIEWFIKMEKICRLAGAMYRDNGMFSKHLESAKKELLRLVRELDSEALQAIMRKDEPETFKVSEDDVEKDVLGKL